MKKITVFFFLLLNVLLNAQVGVNTTTPDPSSMLDITATNKGVLVPRVSLANVTTTMLDGTNTAATGLLIWNTNAATVGGNGVGFYFFYGTQWIPITQTITGNTLDQSYDQGGAGIGKNINATDGAVRINGDDGFLVTGTFGTGNTIDTEVTGNGARMFFNPRKAAFRAGQADGTEWNNSNIGNYSIALGRSNTALNDYDVAIGVGSTASGSYSTALGWANTASGAYSFSMGQNSVASGWSSTVLGRISSALADNSLVFGNNSITNGQFSFAFGNYAETFGTNSMAFGNNVTSRSGYESVFGIYNTDYTPLSVGGFNNADRLFVIGNGTNATNLSNALTIYKDGRMNINDAYTMPTSDGTNGQVMQTNGAGIVTWANPTTSADDQQIDVLSLTGDTLNISLQDDGVPTQTLNLSAIDNQSTDVFNLTGSTLNLSLQNDGVPTQTVDLSPLRDHDWYEVGGTTQPNAITDNIYHTGNVVIGKNTITADNPKLSIEESGPGSIAPLKIVNLRDVSTSTNPHTGLNIEMASTSVTSETGISVDHSNPNATLKYGILSRVQNGSGNNSAFQGVVRGTGENTGLGISILDSGLPSSEQQIGYSSVFQQPSSQRTYGIINSFNTNNLSIDTGEKFGLFNGFGDNVGGIIYGLYNEFSPFMVNTSNKYGSYTRIPSTLGGIHYGLYSDVTKAGSFAGYFLGNVSIGTNSGNTYILPPSRGTNGQIMQTDGVGIVSWVNSSSLDNQQIDVLTLTGDTLNISLQDDGVPNQTINLASIDNQGTDVFSLTGTTLNLSLQNDGVATQTVDLSSLLGTDDQNLTTPTLVGTTLNLGIENGLGTSIDLAPLQDGTGTDDQTIDNFSLSGTTLRLSLENDGQPLQTVNLASLVGTDDQNLVTPTLVGTTLNLNIENGTGTSIDLAPLQDGTGTDDQIIDNFSLSGSTLQLSLENDGQPLQTVDLSILRDHDWYEVGGTNPANSILDNIFTGGDVSIGKNTTALGKLDIEANNKTTSLFLENNNATTGIKSGIINNLSLNNNNNFSAGITNNVNGIAPLKFGIINRFTTNNPGAVITEIGYSTDFISTGNVNFLGNHNNVFPSSPNSGTIIGYQNSISGNITGSFTGLNNINSVDNDTVKTGVNNNFDGGGNGSSFGVNNTFVGNSNGNVIGINTLIVNTGSGLKYGEKIQISDTTPGIHFGIHSDVTKSNSYAGYFLGRVSLGTTAGNSYILPTSRGTNGQIMQTNGTGDVTWVNPTTVFTDTDDQTIDNFSLSGTTLRISLENDGQPLQTVNLASINTDDQNLVTPTLVGTTLNLNIENGLGTSIDLAPLQDGTGTDDQNIQNLAFNTSTNILTVGIENGTSQTVNLSSLSNDWKLTGNTGTNPTTNFIGTTDNQDFSIRTNNTEKVRITAKGQIETTQAQSVWIGNQAGENISTGTRNTFVGHISGLNSTTGGDNTALGGLSLSSNVAGIDNTAIGLAALYNLNTGDGNTAVGEQVAENMTTGNYNTILGHLAAENYTTGNRNTILGYQAGQNAAGDGNVFIGSSAGRSETGSNKLYIENSGVDEDNALLYGEFDNNILRTYGEFQVRQNSSATLSHIQLREDTVNDGARIKFTNAAEIVNSWTLFGRADDTTADSRFNIFHTTTGNIMQFTGDGLVGIMRTPTTNQLEINGTASKSAAGGFIANSDYRLKKNIVTISPTDALNKVLSLRGVTYEWNDDKTGMNRPEGTQLGFVAQEIQEVFPDKVTKDKQGYLQTAYGDYDPIVFQAIKALNDKIEKLENENAALKSALEKINALEAKLDQMNIK